MPHFMFRSNEMWISDAPEARPNRPVAAAYIIAAGFIIQIGSAVFPAWELPNWTFRLVVVFLLIGFPISLILAWAYDVTPQGIRATPAPGVHRRRNLITLIAIGVVVSINSSRMVLSICSPLML